MAQWLLRSKRKATGALLRKNSKKKKYQRGADYLPAHVGAARMRRKRMKGGGTKFALHVAQFAYVATGGTVQKTKILTVVENKADPQFVRRNIITKGAIVRTELGTARVTSRPGQDGSVSAVLVEKT